MGDEAGLSEYEGEVTDLGGKFIMPGIIDSHVHVTLGAGYEGKDFGEFIAAADSKKETPDYMADYMKKNPGLERYRFMPDKKHLHSDNITKKDPDAICPDGEILIQEAQGHSIWVNSGILEKQGITDDTPDPVPGLAFYVGKDGHVTGEMSEGATIVKIILDDATDRSDEEIDAAPKRRIDFSVDVGVSGVFDAGIPGYPEFHERVYTRLCEPDRQGKLPVYVDGCYVISSAMEAEEGLKGLKRYQREYNTEHVKVHTLKLFMDGTLKLHSGAMVTPYEDTGELGVNAFNPEDLVELLKLLNKDGFDFHVHTVGEAASRPVPDGVEEVRKEPGYDFRVKVTSAHLQIQDDADLDRFGKPGVIANYTPHCHCEDINMYVGLFGEKQLGIEDKKGSITEGKDADFPVFDKDLLTAEHEGFSCNKPMEVYFAGKMMNQE